MVEFDYLKRFFEYYKEETDPNCNDAINNWKTHRNNIINDEVELKDYLGDDGPMHFLAHDEMKSFINLSNLNNSRWMIKVEKKETATKGGSAGNPTKQAAPIEPEKANYIVPGIYTDNGKEKTVGYEKANTEYFKTKILPLLRLIIGVFNKSASSEDLKTLEDSFKDALSEQYKAALSGELQHTLGRKYYTEPVKNAFNGKSFTDSLDGIKGLVNRVEKRDKANEALEHCNNYETQYNLDLGQFESDLNQVKLYYQGAALSKEIKDTLGNKLDIQMDEVLTSKNIDDILEAIQNAEIEDNEKEHIINLCEQYKSALSGGIIALNLIQKTKLYRDHSAKQLFHKIMIIESASEETCCKELMYRLPIITKIETIDKLYNDFIDCPEDDADKLSPVFKAYKIMENCYNGLGELPSLENQVKITRMLYDYAKNNLLTITEDSPNLIYYGSPGTGKTFTVNKGIHMLMKVKDEDEDKEDERAVRVQCHPGFGYEEFIEGLKPVGFTENGTIKLEIVNGKFKNLCIKAKDDPDHDYFFVADEINRANLSAMFGETLSLLEANYRDYKGNKRNTISTPMSEMIEAYINSKFIPKYVTVESTDAVVKSNADIIKQIKKIAYECNLVYEGDEKHSLNAKEDLPNNKRIIGVEDVKFGVPKNIRFIGMMNDVDKSIDAFDLALRRRFKWIRKDCDYDALERVLVNNGIDAESISQYRTACENLNNYISGNDSEGLGFGKPYEFGHAYFMEIITYLKRGDEIVRHKITLADRKHLFEERLKPVLTEYIRSFKDDSEINTILDAAINVFAPDSKNKTTQNTTDEDAEPEQDLEGN